MSERQALHKSHTCCLSTGTRSILRLFEILWAREMADLISHAAFTSTFRVPSACTELDYEYICYWYMIYVHFCFYVFMRWMLWLYIFLLWAHCQRCFFLKLQGAALQWCFDLVGRVTPSGAKSDRFLWFSMGKVHSVDHQTVMNHQSCLRCANVPQMLWMTCGNCTWGHL